MIDGKRILAVVPARGGSKGVTLKNLRPVLGIPIVARVGDCIRDVHYIDRAVVSTDHEEIAKVAAAAGIAAPFRRPADLSGDHVADWPVLQHALIETERVDGTIYDIILMLQPTAPLRTAAQVQRAIEYFVTGGYDAVWTVTETDLKYHPLKQFTMRNGLLDYFDKDGKTIVARQQLSPVYHVNGVAYVFSRDCILEQKSKLGRKTGGLILDGPDVSIDTLADFDTVERHLNAQT